MSQTPKNTIYLLDFRSGTVKTVDASMPARVGYVLAALGSPPDNEIGRCTPRSTDLGGRPEGAVPDRDT